MVRGLWRFRGRLLLLAVALLSVVAQAQTSSADPETSEVPQNVEDVLHQMSDRADIIFVGQVVAIRPHDDGDRAAGFVEIDFRIDQPIRGCTGGTYVLKEWAGLWSGDARRYQTGQRLLLMLHEAGASGMSSPVGGMDGAIPIRGEADASQLAAADANPPALVADLRWLGAKVVHPASYVLQAPLSAAPLTMEQQMAPVGNAVVNPIIADDDSSSRASTPVQQASVDTVTKLLASWKKVATDVQ